MSVTIFSGPSGGETEDAPRVIRIGAAAAYEAPAMEVPEADRPPYDPRQVTKGSEAPEAGLALPGQVLELKDAEAAEAAAAERVQVCLAALEENTTRRETAIRDLADAEAKIAAAAVLMVNADKSGPKKFQAAAEAKAALESMVKALDEIVLPTAQANLEDAEAAHTSAERDLHRARIEHGTRTQITPRLDRIRALFAEIEAEWSACKSDIWEVVDQYRDYRLHQQVADLLPSTSSIFDLVPEEIRGPIAERAREAIMQQYRVGSYGSIYAQNPGGAYVV